MMGNLHENAYKFQLNHLLKTSLDATLMSDIEILYFKVIGAEFFSKFDFNTMNVADVHIAIFALACLIKESIQDILCFWKIQDRHVCTKCYSSRFTCTQILLAQMEEESQAILAYIEKYYFQNFKEYFANFKLLSMQETITRQSNIKKTVADIPLVEQVKQRLTSLTSSEVEFNSFFQNQEGLRCNIMDATAMSIRTTLTPKILKEELKDCNWAVDQILTTAPAYEKKGQINQKKDSETTKYIESESKNQAVGQWITAPSSVQYTYESQNIQANTARLSPSVAPLPQEIVEINKEISKNEPVRQPSRNIKRAAFQAAVRNNKGSGFNSLEMLYQKQNTVREVSRPSPDFTPNSQNKGASPLNEFKMSLTNINAMPMQRFQTKLSNTLPMNNIQTVQPAQSPDHMIINFEADRNSNSKSIPQQRFIRRNSLRQQSIFLGDNERFNFQRNKLTDESPMQFDNGFADLVKKASLPGSQNPQEQKTENALRSLQSRQFNITFLNNYQESSGQKQQPQQQGYLNETSPLIGANMNKLTSMNSRQFFNIGFGRQRSIALDATPNKVQQQFSSKQFNSFCAPQSSLANLFVDQQAHNNFPVPPGLDTQGQVSSVQNVDQLLLGSPVPSSCKSRSLRNSKKGSIQRPQEMKASFIRPSNL